MSRVLESHRSAEHLDKPSFALDGETLLARRAPTFAERALHAVARRSALAGVLVRELDLAREARPIVRQILRNMTRETMARGENLAVVRIPLSASAAATFAGVPRLVADASRRRNDFADVVANANVVYLDPWAEMQRRPRWEETCYLEDGHLSARGHYVIAKQIARHVFGRNIDW